VVWLPGRHLQTIVPALWPARRVEGPEEERVVQVADDAAVRIHLSPPVGRGRGTVLLVHGMGGSSESGYMRRTARLAVERGWWAVRMNCRNCGGTEALSSTLYNAGQSDDVRRVLEHLDAADIPRPFAAVGFSLGGALVLRDAGRAGARSVADAVAAVNPPIDLEACCRSLERRENAVYHAHFTMSLCRLLRRIHRVRSLDGPPPAFRKIRTLRRLDASFTAPDAGYASAEDYYAGASAAPHLSGLAVPALVISSENDPLVPAEIFEPHRRSSPLSSVRFLVPRRGGHLGYWQSRGPRFWAGTAALDFLDRSARRA
jgi:hypothetical protein